MKVTLLSAALRVAASLAEARVDLAWAVMESVKAERALAAQRALLEQAAVEAAGGEQGLGPNETAQKRALALAVAAAPAYQAAEELALTCALDRRMCEVDVLTLRDQLDIALQGLTGGVQELDEDLLSCKAGFDFAECDLAEGQSELTSASLSTSRGA